TRTEMATEMAVRGDGPCRCRETSVAYGTAAWQARHSLLGLTGEGRRQHFTSAIQEANLEIRLRSTRLDERQLRDLDQPVCVEVDYDIPEHFTTWSPPLAADALPDRQGYLTEGKLWRNLLATKLEHGRKWPLVLSEPFELRHRWLVKLPAAYRLTGEVQSHTISSRWGSVRIQARNPTPRTGGEELRAGLEKVRVEPADFAAFRRFCADAGKQFQVPLYLQPTTNPADILLLEAVLAISPSDSISAAALAQLYRNQGKPEEARRVLQRA